MAVQAFQHIQQLDQLPPSLRGGVVAIGNFDGLHRGHQAIIDLAKKQTRANATPVLILTFEPHPRTFFCPDRPVWRLTSSTQRAAIASTLGADGLIELSFDSFLAAMSPEVFVEQILVDGLRAQAVITGADFHYGAKRAGSAQSLKEAGQVHGFEVILAEAQRDHSNEVISSSRIRTALTNGELDVATNLLGYRPFVEGMVISGRQLGRSLGFPTANMKLAESTDLAFGIYAVRVRTADNGYCDGVANYGIRPTIEGDREALFETYLFDFENDLYGQNLRITLCSYLRAEQKFDGLGALKAQMERDAEMARARLQSMSPLSDLDQQMNFIA